MKQILKLCSIFTLLLVCTMTSLASPTAKQQRKAKELRIGGSSVTANLRKGGEHWFCFEAPSSDSYLVVFTEPIDRHIPTGNVLIDAISINNNNLNIKGLIFEIYNSVGHLITKGKESYLGQQFFVKGGSGGHYIKVQGSDKSASGSYNIRLRYDKEAAYLAKKEADRVKREADQVKREAQRQAEAQQKADAASMEAAAGFIELWSAFTGTVQINGESSEFIAQANETVKVRVEAAAGREHTITVRDSENKVHQAVNTASFQKTGPRNSISLFVLDPNPPANPETDFKVMQNKDNTLTITGYTGTRRQLVIPEAIQGLRVTIIGGEAFSDKKLLSVVIPNTVTDIQARAFSGNPVKSLNLGNGVKTIGDSAFNQHKLSELRIPNSVISIGETAFAGIERREYDYDYYIRSDFRRGSLKKVTFGSGLQTIGTGAFACNQIAEITFGSGLQTIGEDAFAINQIAALALPSSLRTISIGAFAYNRLESLTIPNSVTLIKSFTYNRPSPFSGNPLATVVIPASLARRESRYGYDEAGISYGVFKGIPITRITLPANMDEDTMKENFEESLVNFWQNQNKAAGIYFKEGQIWKKQ